MTEMKTNFYNKPRKRNALVGTSVRKGFFCCGKDPLVASGECYQWASAAFGGLGLLLVC